MMSSNKIIKIGRSTCDVNKVAKYLYVELQKLASERQKLYDYMLSMIEDLEQKAKDKRWYMIPIIACLFGFLIVKLLVLLVYGDYLDAKHKYLLSKVKDLEVYCETQ